MLGNWTLSSFSLEHKLAFRDGGVSCRIMKILDKAIIYTVLVVVNRVIATSA